MWDLRKEVLICMDQIQSLGIPMGNIVKVNIKHKGVTYWGLCSMVAENSFALSINGRLLSGDIPVNSLRTVISHELLHTAPGCMNHGRKWREYGKQVQDAFGYRIQRLASDEELNVPSGLSPLIIAERIPPDQLIHLQIGDFVSHKTIGQGIVTALSPLGRDVIIQVSFLDGTTKEFMRSQATLYMSKEAAKEHS